MRIPKYWIRHQGHVNGADGQPLRLSAWGWSESSEREAEAKARDQFQVLGQRLLQGLDLPHGYAYGDRPVREQILEQVPGADGSVDAMLTRNTYGAVVLNTARAMFVDVDTPETAPTLKGIFGRLFGGSSAPPEDAPLTELRAKMRATRGSFRLYRTAGGFRLLAIDRPYTPASSESENVMRAVGADPAFVQLCRIQDSFRARLTPKPFRMDQAAPPGQFPRDPEAQTAFDSWLRTYENAAQSRATCKFVETIGSTRVDPAIEPIVRLHDERTKSASSLPLA